MSFFGRAMGWIGLGGGGSLTPAAPATPAQMLGVFGPPPEPQLTTDRIISELWVQPYRGPLDLDPDGGETGEMRDAYRRQYREVPVLRAALRGKADAISCLEVTVLPADKNDPRANMAAEFVRWAVEQAPRGWRGVIDTLYTPGSLDGFALAEKKLKPAVWKGRRVWGLAHLRSLDTRYLRLQLDQYRNLLAVVNLRRGLEYYSPDDVVLYSHNPLFNNPFGQSDVRAATRAANIMEDVYKLWYLALKIYGLPYLTGKSKPQNRQLMADNLAAMREAGYIVTDADEEVKVVNLAAAAATDGFERAVHTLREDMFFAVRGAAQPFMEGDGGADAHTDTQVQKAASDAGEYGSALDVADAINRQLIPWLVAPNFGPDCPMPRVKLGGTNWDETDKLLGILEKAQAIGMDVSAEAAHELTSLPPPRDGGDRLVSAAEKQQRARQQPQAVPGAAGGGVPPGIPPAAAAPASPEPEPRPQPEPAPATFSAGHVDGGRVARVVGELLAELGV